MVFFCTICYMVGINTDCFSGLKQNVLFQDIEEKELEAVLSRSRLAVKKFHKGALLFFRGDAYTELYIICKGSVSAEIQDLNGKTLKIETLKAPDLIAPGILFASDNHLPVSITAQSDLEVLVIPKQTLLTICSTYRNVLLNLLRDSGDKIVILSEKLRLVQFSTIRQKIAVYLLDQANRQGSDIVTLRYTKETLAEIFGVTRPSLSRVFSELYREEILVQNGREVTILDRENLESCIEADE